MPVSAHTISPVSGEEVKRDTVTDVVDFINSQEEGSRLMIISPFVRHAERSLKDDLKVLLSKGYTRIVADGEIIFIEELLEKDEKALARQHTFNLLIDRASGTARR